MEKLKSHTLKKQLTINYKPLCCFCMLSEVIPIIKHTKHTVNKKTRERSSSSLKYIVFCIFDSETSLRCKSVEHCLWTKIGNTHGRSSHELNWTLVYCTRWQASTLCRGCMNRICFFRLFSSPVSEKHISIQRVIQHRSQDNSSDLIYCPSLQLLANISGTSIKPLCSTTSNMLFTATNLWTFHISFELNPIQIMTREKKSNICVFLRGLLGDDLNWTSIKTS